MFGSSRLSVAGTGGRDRSVVISALGVVEILAWGSSFYLPAVLAGPTAKDTGWPLAWVVGGLAIGLLVAALASPHVGAVIHRRGGRPVLALAAVLLAAGLAVLAVAPILPIYLAGWVLLGLGMGCGLYDPAFATLGRVYGAEARPAITSRTDVRPREAAGVPSRGPRGPCQDPRSGLWNAGTTAPRAGPSNRPSGRPPRGSVVSAWYQRFGDPGPWHQGVG